MTTSTSLPTVWVDTDIALGSDRGDVDDGYALAAVLAAHRVGTCRLIGISTVAGNTDRLTAARCARELLDVAGLGASIQVVETQAGVAERLVAVPDATEILAIGPLSNVAAALRLDSTLIERTRVSVVATVMNRRRSPLLPLYCLNWRHDPEAARLVFAASSARRRLRVMPLDVVRQLSIGGKELRALAEGSDLGRYLAEHSRRWLRQSWWRYQSRSFPLWDLVAAMAGLGQLADTTWEGGRLAAFDAVDSWARFVASLAADDSMSVDGACRLDDNESS